MAKVFYVIYTTNKHYEQEYPSYLMMVNDGYMLQGNLYDASKYTKKEIAEKELKVASNIFKNKKFEIISVDRRIFGKNPRYIVDLT